MNFVQSKASPPKRTSIDGIVDDPIQDLQKPPKVRLVQRLSGTATSIQRGSAVRASELESLRFSPSSSHEVVFDAEAAEDRSTKPDLGSLVDTHPSQKEVDSKRGKEDAVKLNDADIGELVAEPE